MIGEGGVHMYDWGGEVHMYDWGGRDIQLLRLLWHLGQNPQILTFVSKDTSYHLRPKSTSSVLWYQPHQGTLSK